MMSAANGENVKYYAYLICKERGHVSNGIHEGHETAQWTYCKYCGTKYWTTTTTVLHEENAPELEIGVAGLPPKPKAE